MSDSAEGKVEMSVYADRGHVVQRFARPMQLVVYDPQNCLDVSEAMAAAAFEAREGVKPVGDALKAELVERHRIRLTQRVAVMLNSLREDRTKSNGHVAKAVVDAMLREVF